MNTKEFHNASVDINKLWYQSHKELIRKVANELKKPELVDELTEKFLGTEIKIKKFRDPKEPKRPKTAFLFFCDEFRPKLKMENDTLSLGDMMTKLGEIWRTYGDEEKEQYIQKYNDAKYTYEEQMEEYRDNSF